MRLAEALECIGGQLSDRDPAFALEAALLLDRIQKGYPKPFENDFFWRNRIPGSLGNVVLHNLNKALGVEGSGYLYEGLERVEKVMADDPLIQRYSAGEE